ncbi:MAG TPA: DNA-binding response regulator, partial [Lachnospiraceae bacterium]|nr:DNA-binding response regulator [Lachnospiraceae bacterium]
HVSNLRRKIKEAGASEEYIRTVYGIGFQLK